MCCAFFMFSKGHICTLNRPGEPKLHKLHKNKSSSAIFTHDLNYTKVQMHVYLRNPAKKVYF